MLPAAIIIPIVIGALGWRAFSAGRYSGWSVVSLMIVAMMTLLAGLAIWNGYIVDRGDVERRKAEGVLHRREVELREARAPGACGQLVVGSEDRQRHLVRGTFSYYAGAIPCCPRLHIKSTWGSITPQSSARLDAAIQSAIQTGAPYELDLEMVRADGAIGQSPAGAKWSAMPRARSYWCAAPSRTLPSASRPKTKYDCSRACRRWWPRSAERRFGATTSGKVLDDAAAQVAQALGVDYCKVLELLPNRDALLMRSGVGLEARTMSAMPPSGAGTDSQAGYTLLSGEPVVVEDLQDREAVRWNRAAPRA